MKAKRETWVATRGMLGLRLEMLTATQGMAIVVSVFNPYREKIAGDILSRAKGLLLASKDEVVTLFGC